MLLGSALLACLSLGSCGGGEASDSGSTDLTATSLVASASASALVPSAQAVGAAVAQSDTAASAVSLLPADTVVQAPSTQDTSPPTAELPGWVAAGSTAAAVDASFFGMHIHRAAEGTAWPVSPFGTWRLWDAAVDWASLEPVKGRFNFDRLDRLIALAEQHGVEPVLTLGITPRWAASLPSRPFVYGRGGNSMPRDLADWEDYVRAVATRYRGRLRLYELWNEPTFDEIDTTQGFFAGSVHDMVALARVAHGVLKSVDPASRLISPGFTDEGRRLALYLSAGGAAYTDVVAHHFYAEVPELNGGYVGHVRATMAAQGVADRPLWNTESGYWPQAAVSGENPLTPHTDAEIAAAIVRSQLVLAAQGVTRSYFYSWERLVDGARRQAAFETAQAWLTGARVVGCARQQADVLSPWVCRLDRGARSAWAVWSPRGARSFDVAAQWQVSHRQGLDGRVQAQSGATLVIDAQPVLLLRDAQAW